MAAENPKPPYQCILDLGESEKQELCERRFIPRIFPADIDFTKACSCLECRSKINDLIDFEADIIHRSLRVHDHFVKFNADNNTWLYLDGAVHGTKQLLCLLHNKLKAAAALASQDDDDYDDVGEQKSCDYDENEDLLDIIKDMISYVDGSGPLVKDNHKEVKDKDKELKDKEVKDKEAASILQKMIINEEKHQEDENKCAGSALKKHIQQQMKLAKTIPVDDMELIAKDMYDALNQSNRRDFVQAKEFISCAISDMIYTRECFWRNHQPILVQEHHKSNQVDQTLTSLLNKAESIKNKWEKKFPDLFNF